MGVGTGEARRSGRGRGISPRFTLLQIYKLSYVKPPPPLLLVYPLFNLLGFESISNSMTLITISSFCIFLIK
jgi:hypothetical protein